MSETHDPSAPTHVGDNVQRADDTAKVTGEAMYASDMAFAGMLYAQVKKSPHARAKILADQHLQGRGPAGRPRGPHRQRARLPASACTSWTRTSSPRTTSATTARRSPPSRRTAPRSRAGPSTSSRSSTRSLPPVLNHMDALKPDAPLVHPDLGTYDYVGRLQPPAGHQRPQPLQDPQGRRRQGLRRVRSGSSSASTPTLGPARAAWRPTSPSSSGRTATR